MIKTKTISSACLIVCDAWTASARLPLPEPYTAPACGLTVTNTFVVAGGEIVSKAPMSCSVPLTFAAGATVTLTNSVALPYKTVKEYTICSCPGGISGSPRLVTEDSNWHLRKASDGKSLSLFHAAGMIISVE